jgi:hypothetical protein
MVVTDLSNSFHPVPKVKSKKDTKSTRLRKRSKKLAKLERQRDKDIVKEGICEICEKYSKRLDPHEIFGGSNRKRSINHKFIKLICRECHHNEDIIKQLRIETQKEYEKTHTRQDFINLIGKSCIKEDLK